MAYVLLFAPPEFCAIPKHGMIQFHPSLLPLHRGPASIPWAIIRGRSETGLTIFRPTPGLDEGPVILQKRVEIGPDDTDYARLSEQALTPDQVEARKERWRAGDAALLREFQEFARLVDDELFHPDDPVA